jgi:hypothetical protein
MRPSSSSSYLQSFSKQQPQQPQRIPLPAAPAINTAAAGVANEALLLSRQLSQGLAEERQLALAMRQAPPSAAAPQPHFLQQSLQSANSQNQLAWESKLDALREEVQRVGDSR